MPVTVDQPTQVFDQNQFGRVAYEVVEHALAIHNEFGRFFEEGVYQNELIRRLGQKASKEIWIYACQCEFQKAYRVDLLVDHGAPFELKAVDKLCDLHRSQLINYLMLTGLHHGKLINFRPNRVEHEFVNNHVTLAQRQAVRINLDRWSASTDDERRFQSLLVALLHDWGSCLDLELYVDGLTHFFGGLETVVRDVDVRSHGIVLGTQKLRLVNERTAFKLTAFPHNTEVMRDFESHVRRLLHHTSVEAMLWANLRLDEVEFVTIRRG